MAHGDEAKSSKENCSVHGSVEAARSRTGPRNRPPKQKRAAAMAKFMLSAFVATVSVVIPKMFIPCFKTSHHKICIARFCPRLIAALLAF